MAESAKKITNTETRGTITKKTRTGVSLKQDMDLYGTYFRGEITRSEYQKLSSAKQKIA